MVLDASFPSDIRVEKEAVTLINSNLYEVFLLCLKKKNQECHQITRELIL